MKKIISFVLFLLFVIKADIALANIEKVSLFDQEMAPEYHELAVQLKKVLENEKGTYGIFVMDLKSGRTFGINHLELFHAASTFKLPLNVYLYRQIACGLIDDKKTFIFKKNIMRVELVSCNINLWAVHVVLLSYQNILSFIATVLRLIF